MAERPTRTGDAELIEFGRRIQDLYGYPNAGTYSGGPPQSFAAVGRDTLTTLLLCGLNPRHRVLDFGAGALRLGYWLMRLLDPERYFAIEPQKRMIEAGRKVLFDDVLWNYKNPTIAISDKCDMTRFGVQFDYVVARSILTHATPGMLIKILREFRAAAAPGAQFLASYWAASGPNQYPEPGEIGDDLPADDWRFIKVVKYSREQMEKHGADAGLKVEEFTPLPLINQQIWLRFTVA